MAFFLQSADIAGARRVAERALRTISYREQDEKYNVWVAYLNLELKYGDAETLEKVFARACAESKVSNVVLWLCCMLMIIVIIIIVIMLMIIVIVRRVSIFI